MSNPNALTPHHDAQPTPGQGQEVGNAALQFAFASQPNQGDATPTSNVEPQNSRQKLTDWRALEGSHPSWIGFDRDGNPKSH